MRLRSPSSPVPLPFAKTETAPQPLARRILILMAVVLAGVLVVWAMMPERLPHRFTGTVIQSPAPAAEFTLNSADGPVSLSDHRGKLVLLYFGYSFCPDVCPTTLAAVAKALDQLGGVADDVQLIMVSVDPARDTPERIAEYVGFFRPTFVGVTGAEEQIAEVAAAYGVFYQAHEGSEATGYLVEHTATVMGIDEAGDLEILFPYPTAADALAADLEYLLR